MMGLSALITRNCKLFFKDKGMFVTSLITPVILLVLYVAFLSNVYREAFTSALVAMPEGFSVPEELINGTVGGELISSLLAVCCVTVAFCSNLLMVQDKVSGAVKDIRMAPVKRSTMALGYFFASALSTLLICIAALVASLGYLYAAGWYLTAADVGFLVLDVILLVLFGTALSSVVNFPLSTSGQSSAVGTIVSAGYGFLCGAYMPISSFGSGLQKVLSFLPGTYGTSLLRNHALGGALREMENLGVPAEIVEIIKDSVDCNLYFCDEKVEIGNMYVVLAASVVVAVGIYIVMNILSGKKSVR